MSRPLKKIITHVSLSRMLARDAISRSNGLLSKICAIGKSIRGSGSECERVTNFNLCEIGIKTTGLEKQTESRLKNAQPERVTLRLVTPL